ncbi:hypothetical protein CRG98_000607 [Punica granatum]|uniref:Uncharacterized protein n=1 Tax=Punica granatum TaxID=22663 RepID=A0A2I0LFH1_PUNGR|nr:hypothetical protein CRG98_000607 [Punica granatum]
MEGSGLLIGEPQPLNQSRALSQSSRSIRGLGPPIGDSDPSIKVAGTHEGRRPLGGGVKVTDWRPRPSFPFDFLSMT